MRPVVDRTVWGAIEGAIEGWGPCATDLGIALPIAAVPRVNPALDEVNPALDEVNPALDEVSPSNAMPPPNFQLTPTRKMLFAKSILTLSRQSFAVLWQMPPSSVKSSWRYSARTSRFSVIAYSRPPPALQPVAWPPSSMSCLLCKPLLLLTSKSAIASPPAP